MANDSQIGSITLTHLGNMTPRAADPQLIPIQRDGVDGTAFILSGTKGEPFQLRGLKTYSSLANALAGRDAFQALIDGDPVSINWGGAALSGTYKVIRIDEFNAKKHLTATDGSTAHAYVTLTLIPL